MYARGLSTRDIQAHIEEIYGVTISPNLVSAITEAVMDEATTWQNSLLETTYVIVYFDALWINSRDEGLVQNKTVYLAIAVTCAGTEEILGLWIEQTEGAKSRARVMTELRNRGTTDALIAAVDGLEGFPEAINALFPQAVVQAVGSYDPCGTPALAFSINRSKGVWPFSTQFIRPRSMTAQLSPSGTRPLL